MYSWNEIKQSGDCQRYMTECLGMQEVSKGMFNCPWRPGSDSGSFKVEKDQFFCHVEKEGGSILDLCARVNHGGDLQAAAEELGKWLGLAGKDVVRKPGPRLEAGQKIVCTYDYQSAEGVMVAQKIRIEPGKNGRAKDFKWRMPKTTGAGWDYKRPEDHILYRLPDVSRATTVIVCEGEKDADLVRGMGHDATTAPDGAGKWEDSFTDALRGKDVVILRDNDEAGQKHADLLGLKLKNYVKSLRVLCPSDEKKGDVSDWYNKAMAAAMAGDGEEAEIIFQRMLESAPNIAKDDPLVTAKDLNRSPFSNALESWEVAENGKQTMKQSPKRIMDLVRECHARFLGFPRTIGTTLFDFDRCTGRIRYIRNSDSLSAWMAEKSNHPLMWHRLQGACSIASLYESLLENAANYSMISATPSFPRRDDVYYTCGDLPKPTADFSYFTKLTNFFNPASEEDAAWIRVFFASCLFYDKRSPERPLWVIDSTAGQGSGKSTLVEMAAHLLGTDIDSQTPIVVPFKQFNNETQAENIMRRVLSATGRRKRILLLDNVCGEFESPDLAAAITMPALSGRAPYGRGEETRPNDLTYVLTANSATLDADLAKRAVFVSLDRPSMSPTWKQDVKEYMDRYRYQIIADIFGALRVKCEWEAVHTFRMAYWDQTILRPLVNEELYHAMVEKNMQRQGSANVDEDIAERIRSKFEIELNAIGINEDDMAFIHSNVATRWVREVFKEERQQETSTHIMQRLQNYAKTGQIPELTRQWERYPHNGTNRKRGFEWNLEKKTPSKPVNVVGFVGGKASLAL